MPVGNRRTRPARDGKTLTREASLRNKVKVRITDDSAKWNSGTIVPATTHWLFTFCIYPEGRSSTVWPARLWELGDTAPQQKYFLVLLLPLATRTNNWSVTQILAGHPEEFSLFFLPRRQDEHVTSNDQPNPDMTKQKHDPTVQNKGVSFFSPPIQIRMTNFVPSVPNKTSTNKWKGHKDSQTRTTTHQESNPPDEPHRQG